MGGGEIYRQALPFAQRLYITEVDIEVEGDAYFPAFSTEEWQEVQRVAGQPAEGQPTMTSSCTSVSATDLGRRGRPKYCIY